MTLNSNITLSKLKRRFLKHVWIARIALGLGIALLASSFILVSFLIFKSFDAGRYYQLSKNFLFPSQSAVKIIEGKINILVMGKGGAGHDAPDLTDTMIFLSIDTNKKSVTSISIPRDVWIKEMRAKINSAYYYGNKKESGGGLVLAKSTVEQVIGQPVNYSAVVDFGAFKDIVDALGGIEVNVENTFTDNLYPITGRENDLCNGDPLYKCRYKSVTFNKGTQIMNGDTALIFVRSRHADGDEGTDIARDARQQKVIAAIKAKVMDPKIYLDPKKVNRLIKIVETYVETDIKETDAAAIARYGFDNRNNISSFVIPEDLLINPPISKTYDNLFVFIPVGGNWNKVHEWVTSVLN